MSEQEIQDLLRQGIEAAREGKKEQARQLFERVTELDEDNEKAWFWMASVVETDEEKRICLNNVLYINPDNERARTALEKLETKQKDQRAEEEVMPGITRRQMTLYGGGGVLVVVLILIIVFVVITGNNARRAAEERAATSAVLAVTNTLVAMSTQVAGMTATQLAIATPTLPPSPTRRDELPPTWTSVPAPTDINTAREALPPPPPEVPGRIVAWGGRDVLNNGFLPLVVFNANDPASGVPVGDLTGRNPDIRLDGSRIMYTRYFPVTFDFGLEEINTNATQPLDVGQLWRGTEGLLQAEQPTYSLDSRYIAFVALEQETNNKQVFVLSLDGAPSLTNSTAPVATVDSALAPPTLPPPANPQGNAAIIQLTSDQVAYSDPAISPDGSRVVVVRNDANSANPGEDIVIIDVASQVQTPLTNDFSAFVEGSPRWSPDGARVVYHAAPANDPDNNDIVERTANGSGIPIPIIRDTSDDILPVFSPDGRYLAFSSNRNGKWDIYIYDTTTQTTYQLTNQEEDFFNGGWSQ